MAEAPTAAGSSLFSSTVVGLVVDQVVAPSCGDRAPATPATAGSSSNIDPGLGKNGDIHASADMVTAGSSDARTPKYSTPKGASQDSLMLQIHIARCRTPDVISLSGGRLS